MSPALICLEANMMTDRLFDIAALVLIGVVLAVFAAWVVVTI